MNKHDRKQILKLTEQVGELNGTVEQMDKNISKNFNSLEKRVVNMHNSTKVNIKSNEIKIDENEKKIAHIRGRSAGIAFAVSLIVSVVGIGIALYRSLFR